MNKVKTDFVIFEHDVYFCYDSDEYWFETDHNKLDVMSADMITFAFNYTNGAKDE